MSAGDTKLTGPDFRAGVKLDELVDGAPTLGHADGEAVVVVRRGDTAFAVGATCTHYGGPLAEGLVVGDTIRCPWHHACFSLTSGEALAAPAFNPVSCFATERRGDQLHVLGKQTAPATKASASHPKAIVIVGSGAAGHAAAEMLRRRGYAGKLTLLGAEATSAVDRPNLSKDYLAGSAPEEWMPLKPPEYFTENGIELVTGARVTALDVKAKTVTTESGQTYAFDKLLLATGAEPVKLTIPGSDLPHVHTLRTLADSRAIIESSKGAKRAVVIGASFIGLEVAAALRARGLEVHVVAPEVRPLERVLGSAIGDFVRALHVEHGVNFHLEATARSIDAQSVTLMNGSQLPAELVVCGIGVRPRLELAEKAGLTLDRGVVVDRFLQTSAPDIFAAGDIARWPDPHSGQNIRVEHWAVAQRQGQVAARNLLGEGVPCDFVPFFWSQHYDVGISYVGHAEKWESVEIDGELARRDCRVELSAGGKTLAVITLGRDLESLRAETKL